MPIYPRGIVRTSWFDLHYSALNVQLGAQCGIDFTEFSIWAPTATSVKLYLNNNFFLLQRCERGVWSRKLDGDWHGFAYEYEIIVNGHSSSVNDPYAKASLVNSVKSVIVDFARTDQSNGTYLIRPKLKSLQDAIIYELHVRDATIHSESGVTNKGKFLGLTETSTTTPNGYSTAISYMKELGITHVQLLPIHDFARVNELNPTEDYNWGYDPL